MSFVQRLRMANMFPQNGQSLGDATIPDDNIDIGSIIEQSKNLALWNRDTLNNPNSQPRDRSAGYGGNGLQRVGNSISGSRPLQPGSTLEEPMRFGGVVNGDPGPGRDILNRSSQNANKIYESYKNPQVQAQQMGPSNDAINLDQYFKRKNEETKADATAANAGMRGWKTVTTVDPNDPSKQVTVQVQDGTGEVRPLDLEGTVVRPGSAKDVQAKLDADKQKIESEDMLRAHGQDALNVLDEISKATGQFDEEGNSIEKLSPNAENITGFSGNTPAWLMDLNPNNATARASIDRLMNMLTLDRMQALKNQSKTGTTGFGANMNQKEFGTLVSSASKLKTMNQSEPGYAKELGRIRVLLSKVANGSNKNEQIKPVSSHTNAPNNSGGRIRVRDKVSGKTGTVSEGAFNPQKYDRVQ